MEITVPSRFYYDHVGRDLPSGTVIKDYANGKTKIEADDEVVSDLLSDAEFYWECRDDGFIEGGLLGLCLSARATIKAINDQVEFSSAT